MVGDERARHELLLRLQQVLGDKEAATLMEHLPPDRWPELVTKSDLSPLRADVAVLKSDVAVLKSDVAVLTTDVAVLTTDVAVLKTDVAVLKTDVAVLKTDVVDLRHEMQRGFALVDQRFGHFEERVDDRFEHLEENLELRFASAHDRMESFVRARLDAQTRALLFTIIGALLTMALVAVGTG
jgi:polyhydroxyalkanoate synthesis regulator phasin